MKRQIKILTYVIVLLCISAQGFTKPITLLKSDPAYVKLLSDCLDKIRSSKELNEQFENVSALKRLNILYPNEWKTNYYIAYMDIKLFLMSEDHAKSQGLLDEAEAKLAILHKDKNAVESEIYTLEGYWNYAVIASDPQKNGQLFYKQVLQNYQEAIQLDPTNPRPRLLMTIFKQSMAAFFGKADNTFCDQLKEIEVLFNNFKLKTPNDPNWGYKEYLMIKEQQCK